jgi:hypothetical protein
MKAEGPIEVTLLGMVVMVVSREQELNALLPMVVIFVPRTTVRKSELLANAAPPTVVTPFPMTTLVSP